MAYVSGTQAATATPATGLYNLIAAQLTAHAAWDLVESTMVGAVQYHVWKCLGTLNSFGTDWYVAFAIQSATDLRIKASEGYNPVTHKMIRPCSVNVAPSAVDFSQGNGAEFLMDAATIYYHRVQALPTGIGIDYGIRVGNDSVLLCVKHDVTDQGFFASIFDPLIPAFPFPICCGSVNSFASNSEGVGFSRHPNLTTNTESFKGNPVFPMNATLAMSPNVKDLLHNKAIAWPVFLMHNNGGANAQNVSGRVWGWLPDWVTFGREVSGGTARNLDTVTIDGNVYRRMRNPNETLHGWFKEVVA